MHRLGIGVAGAGIALIAMAMLGFLLVPFAVVSLPTSYSGSTVIDLSNCTAGYAQGGCNLVTFTWNAPLMTPQAASSVWNARFTGVGGYVPIASSVTCGFGALYQTNLPAYSPIQAKYIPQTLPAGIGSWFTVGGVVYLQSNSEYPCPSNVGIVQNGNQYTQTTVTTAATTTASTTVTVSGNPAPLPPPPSSPYPAQQPPIGQYALGGFMVILGGVFYSKDAIKRGLRM
ncbi:MAG: hypothetical protein KGI38_11400 [Thaumarchaeota archaeon]|nr:hypothetical protein [Nitrososphaerota archaeon]